MHNAKVYCQYKDFQNDVNGNAIKYTKNSCHSLHAHPLARHNPFNWNSFIPLWNTSKWVKQTDGANMVNANIKWIIRHVWGQLQINLVSRSKQHTHYLYSSEHFLSLFAHGFVFFFSVSKSACSCNRARASFLSSNLSSHFLNRLPRSDIMWVWRTVCVLLFVSLAQLHQNAHIIRFCWNIGYFLCGNNNDFFFIEAAAEKESERNRSEYTKR